MNRYFHLVILLLCLSVFNLSASTYKVRRGDNLSKILYQQVPGRIYGLRGNLRKIKQLNPNLPSSNLIRPGQSLKLPVGVGKYTQFELAKMSDLVLSNRKVVSVESEKAIFKPKATPGKEELKTEALKKSYSYSNFKFSPSFSYRNLTSSQSSSNSANVISDLAFGFNFSWNQVYSEKLTSELYTSYGKYSYQVSETKSIVSEDGSYTNFGVSIKYSAYKRLSFSAAVGFRTEPIVRASSSTELVVENTNSPYLSLTPSWVVYGRNNLKFQISFPISQSFSSSTPNIDLNGGFSYGMEFKSSRKIGTFDLFGGIRFIENKNSYNSVETSEKLFQYFLGMGYDLGGEKENESN